jgi:hypothetical protein
MVKIISYCQSYFTTIPAVLLQEQLAVVLLLGRILAVTSHP